jgi:hypothetical protein
MHPGPRRTEFPNKEAYKLALTLHRIGLELRCGICLSIYTKPSIT